MNKQDEKIDWSDEHWKEMLITQRRFMWSEDTVDKFARWIGFSDGMTVADIGCGLGFLGYTFWPYYGKNGKYIGVDQTEKLLKQAESAAEGWADDGETEFIRSDAYKLPLDDNSVDLTICQAVLMHLEKPADALAEMIRITKPGGLAICIEPDNLNAILAKRFNSVPELSDDDYLFCAKVVLTRYKGTMKLGRGDWAIGVKIPHLMKELGLTEIDLRLNDRVWYLEPPYETDRQKHYFEMAKKNILNDKTYKFNLERDRDEFLAGGGDPKDFERYEAIGERYRQYFREQFDNESFYGCSSSDLYIIKGKKIN